MEPWDFSKEAEWTVLGHLSCEVKEELSANRSHTGLCRCEKKLSESLPPHIRTYIHTYIQNSMISSSLVPFLTTLGLSDSTMGQAFEDRGNAGNKNQFKM